MVFAIVLHLAVVPLGAMAVAPRVWTGALLHVIEVTAPTNAAAGTTVQLRALVTNVGSDSTGANWSLRVVLSKDDAPGPDDRLLQTWSAHESLGAGQTSHLTLNAKLPARVLGERHLIVVPGDDRAGGNHLPGACRIDITAPPRPDLLVSRVRAPMVVNGDEAFEVFAEVTNAGAAVATGRWVDAVYMSHNSELDGGDALLAQQPRSLSTVIAERYMTKPMQVSAPPDYRGDVFLIVVTDDGDSIEEYPREDNNVMAVPIEVVRDGARSKKLADLSQRNTALPPRPDLVVRTIDAPPVIFAEEPFTLRYVASNIGSAPTPVTGWIDSVFLSKDSVLDDNDAPLTALNQARPLSPMESYNDLEKDLEIPPDHGGDMFLIVKADGDDEVDETPNESNNALAVPIHVIRAKDRKEVELGKDDEIERLTIAWIPHEDFVKMRAPESEVIQPAVQTKVAHDPRAPVEYDPTPPQPTSPSPPRPAMRRAQQPAEPRDGKPAGQVQAKSPNAKPREVVKASDSQSPQVVADRALDKPAARSTVNRQSPKVMVQPPAKTAKPLPGQPVDQRNEDLPRVAGVDADRAGPPSAQDSDRRDTRRRTESKGPESRDAKPTNQLAAVAVNPVVDGLPAMQQPTVNEPIETVEPGIRPRVEVDESNPQGAAANNPSSNEQQQMAENPGESEASQQAKAARTGRQDRDQPPAPQNRESRPTAVPRVEKQAPLFDRDKALEVRPGRVLTGNGIEIQTVLPQIGIVARSVMYPSRNPRVAVRFNAEGEVTKVTVVQTAGNSSWDIPIVASVYRWRATGENLRKRNRPFEIDVTILIGR